MNPCHEERHDGILAEFRSFRSLTTKPQAKPRATGHPTMRPAAVGLTHMTMEPRTMEAPTDKVHAVQRMRHRRPDASIPVPL